MPGEALLGLCPTIEAHAGDDGVTLRGSERRPGSGGGGGIGIPGGIAIPAPVDPYLVIRDGYTVTEPVTLSDLINFRPASGINHMEPNGWMIVGLDANFYASSATQVQTGELLGRPATVRFTPVTYRWSYGDGTAATLGTSGTTWAALGKTEFEPTATSHVYRTAGTYTVDLTIGFSAEYHYTGTEWIPIAGTVPVAANRLTVVIGGAKTLLVNQDCAAAPAGPGC
ncbi:MAG: hypothetical protein ABI275_02625 [Terrimesophilobacter sp.]